MTASDTHTKKGAAVLDTENHLEKGRTMKIAARLPKARNIVSNILMLLPSIALIASSFAKSAHVPGLVAEMTALGFNGPRLMIVAVLELASATLFLVPKTRPFGLVLVSAYLGGAIAAQLGHRRPPEPAAVLLALIWIGTWLKKTDITT